MTYIFGNWLKCLRNDQNMWEMTQICGKWLKYVGKRLNYLTNILKMWKMTQRFGKWPKYLGNSLDTWGTAEVFENRLNYVGNGLRI